MTIGRPPTASFKIVRRKLNIRIRICLPGNIETISAERSVDRRYSDYLVLW